jgi:hypothetical protein
VLPTPIRPGRRTLERGRWNPRKGDGRLSRSRSGRRRDVRPVRHISSITISPARPSPPPQRHPGTAAPSPALWEYGATRRCHASCYAPYGFPSAAPSSQRTDDDRMGGSHTATLEVAPGRIQATSRHSARSKIRQDDCLLHNTVYHTTTHNYNSTTHL